MNPKVYIIVLNWNMPKDTIECVESLKKLDYDNYKILLVDNASADDSVRMLKEHFPEIEMLQNKENLGFAEGNNTGMRHALKLGADYVFILNNDVVLDKNCVSELIKAAQEYGEAGMLAPKVYYYDYPDTINSLGTSIDWFRLKPYLGYYGQKDEGQFSGIREADILVGCALLVKKEAMEKTGFIDERFFIFHEEADWCLRNKKAGFKNMVIPSAIAYHKASKTMKSFSALTAYYSARNFLCLSYKNASFINRIKVFTGLCFLLIKNLIFLIFGDSRKKSAAFFLGVADYFMGQMGRCKRVF